MKGVVLVTMRCKADSIPEALTQELRELCDRFELLLNSGASHRQVRELSLLLRERLNSVVDAKNSAVNRAMLARARAETGSVQVDVDPEVSALIERAIELEGRYVNTFIQPGSV